MLLIIFVVTATLSTLSCDKGVSKSYISVPIPLEMPNRNDRADQCWLRIEDIELVETVVVYCHLAHSFLKTYIYEYNSRKMIEDDVDVSLWPEDPVNEQELWIPREEHPKEIKDWKLTTILDSVTHKRIYVSVNADCGLIMYTREGMSNYKINCARMLYYFNTMSSKSMINSLNYLLFIPCIAFAFKMS